MAAKVTLLSGYIFAWSIVFLLIYVPLILLLSCVLRHVIIFILSILASVAVTNKIIRVNIHSSNS